MGRSDKLGLCGKNKVSILLLEFHFWIQQLSNDNMINKPMKKSNNFSNLLCKHAAKRTGEMFGFSPYSVFSGRAQRPGKCLHNSQSSWLVKSQELLHSGCPGTICKLSRHDKSTGYPFGRQSKIKLSLKGSKKE